jgi:hypothetical protein
MPIKSYVSVHLIVNVSNNNTTTQPTNPKMNFHKPQALFAIPCRAKQPQKKPKLNQNDFYTNQT